MDLEEKDIVHPVNILFKNNQRINFYLKKKRRFYQVEIEMVMFVFHHTYEMDHELFLHTLYFLVLILLMINRMYHPKSKEPR
jgi:hypothetical protein